jgi:hypothetical protein
MAPFDDPTAIQARLIAELTSFLQARGIPHWLFGGWVVDFLAGEITRPHHDIDLMVWQRDAAAFRQLLAQQGFDEGPSPSGPELDARFSKEGQLVEVMFLHASEAGDACWGQWRLPPDALEARHERLGEIVCPVIHSRVLLECKEACLREEHDLAERERHAVDIARLRSILEKGP